MGFLAECSERNSVPIKSQYLNTAVKYSLSCSWQVNYSKNYIILDTVVHKNVPLLFFE